MQFVGLDIHKKHINACIRDEEGKIIAERKFRNEPQELDKFLTRVNKEDKIALESCICWEHVYDYLDEQGFANLVLANPSQISKSKKKKTDKLDAKKLAKLLRAGLLPEAWPAPKDIRDHRQITRHKASLTVLRTMTKNKVHAILLRHGIIHGYSDVFGKAGTEYLYSLDLPMSDRIQMDNYLKLIAGINELIDNTQDVIEDFARYNYNVKILMTHPGIDYYLASMIDAEIGDIRRFQKISRLTSYAGLEPSVSQSGDKCHIGHITKIGNANLRWALIQAAHVAVMHDSKYAKIFHKIKARRNQNIAYIAVARRILKTIYAMLKNNAKYIPKLKERKAS
jgi:transposase